MTTESDPNRRPGQTDRRRLSRSIVWSLLISGLCLFLPAGTLVSPSWYEEAGTVPTWNYVAVHASGSFPIVEDRDGLLEILRRSVRAYEGPRPAPWAFDDAEPHVETLRQAIVGFRIEITRMEGKWKLGQNHSEQRREPVIQALETEPGEDSKAIAVMMRETL